MEQQQDINGKIIFSHHLSGVISLEKHYLNIWKRKDDHIWFILRDFYLSSNKSGISFNELLSLHEHKDHMGFNTMYRGIIRLLNAGFIDLKYKNVGIKKNSKLYIINENGVKLFEKYMETKR